MSDGREDEAGDGRIGWLRYLGITEVKNAPPLIPWWILLVLDVLLIGFNLFYAVQGPRRSFVVTGVGAAVGLVAVCPAYLRRPR